MESQKFGTAGKQDTATKHPLTLETSVRNVRALLDQARQSFGPETRQQIDAITKQTESVDRIENFEFKEVLTPEAWCYLGVLQLTEIVSALVVSHASASGATAGAAAGERMNAPAVG